MDFNDKRLDEFADTKEQKQALSLVRKYKTISEASRHIDISSQALGRRLKRIAERAYSNKEEISIQEELKIKKELRESKLEIKRMHDELEELRKIADFNSFIDSKALKVPKWTKPRKGKNKRAIATAMLSDTHFDEVVNPAEISGKNAYNREIAESRLKEFFSNVIKMNTQYVSGIGIDGMVLALGGDMVSGNIHEELAQTNHAEIMDTVLFWSERIAAGVLLLAESAGALHVPCVIGNHGRNSKKWRNKGAAEDNFDYLIYKMVERELRQYKEITFDIPLDTNVRWSAYNSKFNMCHGNEFRGGSGVGGIAVPIMRGNYKKQQTEQSVGTPYDYNLIGHFHQFMDLGSVMINGSLKGYDEYCRSSGFGYEPPRQLYFLTDQKHGKTISAPIHVLAENERDLWKKHGKQNQPQWLIGAKHG